MFNNELDKACFQHDMPYGDFKDLTTRTASDKILPSKAFNIAKNPKYDGFQRGLVSMVYKVFDKNTSATLERSDTLATQNKLAGSGIKNENIYNNVLAEELHRLIIRKFKKRKVQSLFIDNIWSAHLADMQLISKFDKGIHFLSFFIDIYSKYVWVIPLKDKKGTTITNSFQKILKESNRKPNQIRVDKGSGFYNSSVKIWLEKSDIKSYLAHNEWKSVVAERFIRTLKNKIYKYMTSASKTSILINQMI